MVNSSRKILRAVRFGGKTYDAGMEDELAKVLPAEDSERLMSKGYMEGSWTAKTAESAKATAEAKTAAEPAKATTEPAKAKEK